MTTDAISEAVAAERARAAAAVRKIVKRELQAYAHASSLDGDEDPGPRQLDRLNVARECLAAVTGERSEDDALWSLDYFSDRTTPPETRPIMGAIDAIEAEVRGAMQEAGGFVKQRDKDTGQYDQGLLDGFALSLDIVKRNTPKRKKQPASPEGPAG